LNDLKHLEKIAKQTKDVYERQGSRFDSERSKQLIERRWLERFAEMLPNGATVLDAGCGSGEPIAQFLIGSGYRIVGIDYSTTMIALARSRFPEQEWHVGYMQDLDLIEAVDGIIGWHSFFHLRQTEQRAVLARFAAHLKPGGPLLLTVGPQRGEVIGCVGGEDVYHASLDPEEYRDVLANLKIDIVDFVFSDVECGHANVLLARKQ